MVLGNHVHIADMMCHTTDIWIEETKRYKYKFHYFHENGGILPNIGTY